MRFKIPISFGSLVILLLSSDRVFAFITTEVKLAPGTSIVGLQKNNYDAFYGVPFARPPLGRLRFRDPLPARWWTGTFRAIVPKLYCWQFDQQTVPLPPSGTEDCLYLNIYRPRAMTQPLNVVVFVHGGGFYAGNNNPLLNGPDYFMDTNQVILVTIAYRLNVFGFLATGDEASPGNYGLKDQTMALRWVKRHIAAFGGDPNGVTFMGHGAGAASVNYHLVSRHSEGLYKNAIMLSGTVNAPWAEPKRRPREVVNRHARALGVQNAGRLESKDLVEVLRRIPAKDITSTVIDLYRWDHLPLAAYLPVVEPPGTSAPFLSVHPTIAMAQGDFVKVPVMTSITQGDGINFVQPMLRMYGRMREFNAKVHQVLPVILGMDRSHPNMTSIVNKVRHKYFGRRGIVTRRNLDNLVRLATDYNFGRPLYTTCQAMARHTPVYVHKFDYVGLQSMSTYYTRTLRSFGVVHGDDLLYLLRVVGLFPYQLTPQDLRVQQVLMKHVLSFIKFSYPGYPAWDGNWPKMVRFRASQMANVRVDQVYVKRHEFWKQIQDMYESAWSRPWIYS